MAEEAEVKSTEEVKPQETKSQEKSQVKKAPSKKKRPFNGKRKGGAPAAAKKPAVFSDSLEDRFPNLAANQAEDQGRSERSEGQGRL